MPRKAYNRMCKAKEGLGQTVTIQSGTLKSNKRWGSCSTVSGPLVTKASTSAIKHTCKGGHVKRIYVVYIFLSQESFELPIASGVKGLIVWNILTIEGGSVKAGMPIPSTGREKRVYNRGGC